MSFYGTSMIFDGVACEEMGLVLYSFDNQKQEATSFASNLSISEDRIEGRYRSLFYGGTVNEPLTFQMVLCASEDRAQRAEPFDRWDLQKVASWLTGHTTYKWLSIVQPDMADVRYRCLCSDLQTVEVAGNVWGFSCKITCDSPFAYMLPKSYSYSVKNSTTTNLLSESSYNGFYYPTVTISNHSGGNLSIKVVNAAEIATFEFKAVPSNAGTITIDCENGVMTAANGANPYQWLVFEDGFHFPRFVRGMNKLTMTGTATFKFDCEWPVNVGG